MSEAERLIALLGLVPHPEGGYFRETFRDVANSLGRSHGTAIYFLLRSGERSAWHRVDATEIWHWYAGSPLELATSATLGPDPERRILGNDLMGGERPQLVVPAGVWQSARALGDYTLVGCTVAPGFEFAHFEVARSARRSLQP